MGENAEVTIAAHQKVTEAQILVSQCDKEVSDLRNKLSVIDRTATEIQARMKEYNVVALPAPTSGVGAATEAEIKPVAVIPPTPEAQPGDTGDFLTNFMDFLKKYWLYALGALFVVIWLVSRSMR